MADDYFLFLIPFSSNDDFFYITFSHISLPWCRHFNRQFGFISAIKKARKEVV
jgi:hypothetical protein